MMGESEMEHLKDVEKHILTAVGTIAVLLIVASQARGFPQGDNIPFDALRRADVYSIYSLLMTNPTTSHGADDNQIYLIANTTIPGFPREPCVRVPTAYESAFAEVMADFNRRRNISTTLERNFTIKKPYELLTPQGVNDFITQHSGPYIPPKEFPQSAIDLFRLTDVYFDHDHTLALTAISTFCGSTCGMAQWKVFEKTKGGWQEKPWVTCGSIA